MTHNQSFEIKTYDIDFAGIVSNIVYIRWLEDMRIAILEPYYAMRDMIADGISPVLLETNIQYKRALRFGDPVAGAMTITALKGIRWTLEAEFAVDGTTTTTAQQSGIFAALETGKPVRIPNRLAQAFEETQ